MSVSEATVRVLRRTDNPAVMWGDEGLLHLIATELGWEHKSYKTSDRVLAALRQTPGELVYRKTRLRGHWVSIFYLPEHAPESTVVSRGT